MMRRRVLGATGLAAALVAGPWLTATQANAAPKTYTPPAVLSTQDLGPIQQNPHVLFRDGLWSGLFNGQSIWTFGDTALNAPNSQGADWDDNSEAWTTDLDGSQGLTLPYDFTENTNDVPDQYLPFTAAEQTFNDEHAGNGCSVKPCNEQLALWNGPVVPDPSDNRLLFFYYELERTVGGSSWKTIGEGIATQAPGGPVVRPIESPASPSFPTLLFGADAPDFDDGTVVVNNELFVFGCTAKGLVQNCDLARVPLSTATERSTWQFYVGNNKWSSSYADAVTVMQGGAAGTSVFWVPALNEYMALYMPPLTNEIVDRVAPEPWGPWSAASNIAPTATPYTGDVDYAGLAHPEFSQNNGLTQYVAYYHPLGPFAGEDRWVQVNFAG